MTAVANPPSFQQRRRSRWGSSGGQSALSALNGDEFARMLLQRESVPRSNSIPSVASSSLSSSAATIIQSNSPATGALMSAATDPSLWAIPGVRKKSFKSVSWPNEKEDTVSNLNTSKNRQPSIMVKTDPNAQFSNDMIPIHQQSSILPAPQNLYQNPSQQSNGNRSTTHSPGDINPVLYLVSLNGTFDRKTISVPFFPDCVRIGRQTNAKTIPSPLNGFFDSKVLSRQHAEVWADGDAKIWIRDVKSSNGTFVNGTRLSAENKDSEPHELQSQDQLELGIDIVSEDQKTVVHHKVAAKIEFAGIIGPSNIIPEMNFAVLDSTNGALMIPSQGSMQTRSRNDIMGNNSRHGSLASLAGNQMDLSQQRHMNFWLTPVTMEQIVKRLTHEIRLARLQTNNLGRVHNFLGSLLSNEQSKEVDKSFVTGAVNTAPIVNSTFHSEIKSRFSDPPAPPPQQPLPEKPDIARCTHPPSLSPKRTSSEPSQSISRISSLIEALALAKKEIYIQSLKLKDMKELLLREKQARELAEETAKKLEFQAEDKSSEHLKAQIEDPVIVHREFVPPTESAKNLEEETREESPTNDSVEPLMVNKNTTLEKRLVTSLIDMMELKNQMETCKYRAETAESERDAVRKTLAELVENIRLNKASISSSSSEQPTSHESNTKITTPPNDSKDEKYLPLVVPIEKSETSHSPAHAPLAMEAGAVIEIISINNNGCDPSIYHTAPYASMLGVVLIGVGIMAYLNGWLPKVER